MNVAALKLLTWVTVAVAVASAVLLAAIGPDLSERVGALDARTANAATRQGAGPASPGTASRPLPPTH